MILNTNVQDLLLELRGLGILGADCEAVPNTNGTTDGRIYILSENNVKRHVLKLDHPQEIALAEQFLHRYREVSLLPDLLYTDPDKTYMVYTFIPGTTHYNRGAKINWLTRLVTGMLNHYTAVEEGSSWGRIDIPHPSWLQFNEQSIREAKMNVGSLLTEADYELVRSLVHRLWSDDSGMKRYLLHGDTGVHNFVFDKGELQAIIDPSPIAGPVSYDFLYAFCSSPDDLNIETLRAGYVLLKNEATDVWSLTQEVMVQLYCRIGICLRHHPHDLAGYLQAWRYWKEQLKEQTL
ncbi:phosphotransferase [Paenibacillus aestuarii]|uniref:Phosphotransferase n=1 Tax=Paenibacillus aestuarii TaxID=516965 RepID=A0ABW0K2B8_9BACL|nr:phosphotransferase [Paenibacillus aestuarii]